jgi:hypothetical protein
MIHKTIGDWNFMFHGNAFLANTQQRGPRGGDKLFAANWVMPMFARESGRHSITFRPMLSLEPLTITKRRYPLLFQSGETAFGIPIVDGQHPHDFFMELAARYELQITDRSQLFLYGGPVGYPALGPPAFPHRSSASENPMAVLGHHQQDSTHISNSVITLGFIRGPAQLEASTFHGAEPDEQRWDLDGGKPDSFASRLTVAMGNNLLGQFSAGRINNREAHEEGLDTFRMTSSLNHNVRFSSGHVSSSLIWGRNKDMTHDGNRIFNAYTLESTIKFGSNWAWTRIENVDRDRTLLVGERPEVALIEEEPIGRIQAYTFGYERDLPTGSFFLNLGLGGQVSFYGVRPELKPIYGNRPAGFSVFLHLRPKGNMADHMRKMHGS